MRRSTPGRTPVAIVATAKVTPTTRQNSSSAPRSSQVELTATDWVSLSHSVESLKLSKAVLPKSTATTPTSPGRTGTPSRLPSGLRSTSVPSAVRPNTARWPTRVEYTSNGSARASHPLPNRAPPTTMTAR